MRVLIYSHDFAPTVGGAQRVASLLAEGLMQRTEGNFEVTVVTQTPAGGMRDNELCFRVVRRPCVRELVRLLREADIVHLAGPVFVPLLLTRLLRKPLVVEHHGYQAICPNGLLFYQPKNAACPGYFQRRRYDLCLRCNARSAGWCRTALLLLSTFPRRWLCRGSVQNICVSHHVKARLRLPHSCVIYHGIEDTCEGTQRVADFANAQPTCFAYVGRLVSEKGLTLALEAGKLLESWGYASRLKFVGDGPERPRLEAMARALSLSDRVVFTGFLGRVTLEEALREVNAVLIPSVCEETAGLAAIEQMMRGRVVIVSDIGGVTEVVGDAGLKFSPGDAAALASCMEQVLTDSKMTSQLGLRARRRALDLFRQEVMVEQHVRLYERLIQMKASEAR